MNKVLEHLKNNIAIYLVIVATIVILCIVLFKQPKEQKVEYDTSMFNVVDLAGANKQFTNNKNQILFIGRESCGACQEFIKSLQIAVSKGNFYVSYLELEQIDIQSEEYPIFVENLNYEYEYNGVTKPLSYFLGNTPMIIFIKNNKIVYGRLGSMSSDAILTLVEHYGI